MVRTLVGVILHCSAEVPDGTCPFFSSTASAVPPPHTSSRECLRERSCRCPLLHAALPLIEDAHGALKLLHRSSARSLDLNQSSHLLSSEPYP
uniref:Uncharacterized protein n=1 Tax=Arundo donax TaxID=35708 RepID=A0A0A9AHY3_ARUDO